MNVYIYALIDPVTNLVRYIGKTVNPMRRLGVHLCDVSDTHKARWIAKLKSSGLRPRLEVIESISDPDRTLWPEREIYWINWMKSEGFHLTNIHDGGRGGSMPSGSTRDRLMASFTPERRAAIADRNKKRVWTEEMLEKKRAIRFTDEHRAKLRAAFTPQRLASMSAARKGIKIPRETVERIAAKIRGTKWSAERRAKIAAAWTPELREKIRTRHLGRKNTPETKAKMRSAALAREERKRTTLIKLA